MEDADSADQDGTNPSPERTAHPLVDRLEVIFSQNIPAIHRYVCKRVPAELTRLMDPDDIVQDVGLEFFRRWTEVDLADADHVRRLLLTVARHRIIDLVREFRSQKRGGSRIRIEDFEHVDGEGPLVGLLEQLAVYEHTPSKSAIAHEVAEHMQRAIDRLPPDYARCIRIRHIEQQSVIEAARLMERTEHAIHMLSARAMAQLKKELLKPVKPA